jgi:hypothetical protein
MRAPYQYKLSVFAVLFAAAGVAFLSGPAAHANTHHRFEIRTLSTQPELVSGCDALVQINLPSSVELTDVRVTLNGRDVTAVFRQGPVPGSFIGLVDGLALGRNIIAIIRTGRGSAHVARLELVNHPITGPIFYRPHQMPFVCETATFVLPIIGATLGPPIDCQLFRRNTGGLRLRSTAGMFRPLPDPTVRPPDVAQTTTLDDVTVPYIVRVESGTINRAIYQIAILHDPVTDPPPNLWTRPPGWNGRLIYDFGGGCFAGYHQGGHPDFVRHTPLW